LPSFRSTGISYEAKRHEKLARGEAYIKLYPKIFTLDTVEITDNPSEAAKREAKELLDFLTQLKGFAPAPVRLAIGQLEQVVTDIQNEARISDSNHHRLMVAWDSILVAMISDIGKEFDLLQRSIDAWKI
jgi:hypothetical protein